MTDAKKLDLHAIVASDDLISLETIVRLVEKAYTVDSSSRGIDFFDALIRAKLTQSPPNLVISDFMPPGDNGIAALQSVRKWNWPSKFILITEEAHTVITQGRDLSADAILIKPFSIIDLERLIDIEPYSNSQGQRYASGAIDGRMFQEERNYSSRSQVSRIRRKKGNARGRVASQE